VAVCLIWGTTYLGIRIALETIPPLLMASIRWIVAGGLLIAVLKLRGERMPDRREWPSPRRCCIVRAPARARTSTCRRSRPASTA